MYTDSIIEEVWRNRNSYVEEHHHDISEIMEDLIQRQKNTNRKVVNLSKAPNKNMHTDKPKLRRSAL